jgi:ribonucleoside-triphosphate reductase
MKRQCHPQETVQQTLDWKSVPQMPRVRTTDGHVMDWDRHAIVAQLVKETQLSKQFYRIDPITEEEAEEIAKEVEVRIKKIGLKHLSGPLVRELVNVALLERGHPEWRNIATRVGTPVYDAHQIDVGTGFEANENANLQENAETSHKKKADKISKEQYLLLLPPKLADSHLNGDIHIHDLEYLGTRSFCMDWDLRYFFYYGLMPDGSGTKSSVAGPAKKAEVAILHAVKALGSAQTNFAGGQGFYNFLTFLAPYLEGMSYEEIEQLMQMFVYEMTQMMVARGGQLVFSSVQLAPGVPKLWKDKPVVYRGRVHNGDPDQAPLRTYSEFEREVRISFKALMNVMLGGDYWGKPFNFPKPEISIEPDFIEEDEEFNAKHPDLPTYSELYDLTFELAAKFGAPYFDNQIPEYRGAGEGISCYQCLSKDELVPIIVDGNVKVDYISNLFERGAAGGVHVDGDVEFARLDASAPSMEFGRFSVDAHPFKGIMRKRYRGKLLNVILESGRRIKVTPDHPLFVYRSGGFEKITTRELAAGNYLPVMKQTGFEGAAVHSIDLEDILIEAGFGDASGVDACVSEIAVKNGMVNILHAKRKGLPKTFCITPEFVRFLGYYLSEGCSDHSGRRYSVRLSFGKHETDLIDDAKQCIKASLGIDPIISIESTAVNVTINSKLLYLLLDALGCGHTAHDKSVPDLLYNVEPSLVGEYLQGVFAGDGNAESRVNILKHERYGEYESRASTIRLKLVSKSAVQKLVLLAGRINVQMNYYERMQKTTHPQTKESYLLPTFIASITAQEQIQKFKRAVGYGASAVHADLRKPAGIFTRIPIEESGLGYSNLTYSSQYRAGGCLHVSPSLIDADGDGAQISENIVEGDIHPLRVRKIEEIDYDGYVYDLVDVSDTHNFPNALGIITGNCCAYNFSSNADTDDDFDDKLIFKDGKHFSMGAWQVISVNCPRAAYRANHDDEALFSELKRLMDIAVQIHKIKREWMNQIVDAQRMPFATQRPLDPITMKKGSQAVDLEGLVYEIGVVGINEMVHHHTGHQLHESNDAWKLAIRAMTEMEFHSKELSEEHGMTIALARTPAETTAGRFAVADILDSKYSECAKEVVKGDLNRALASIHKTRDLPIYYTNGTHVPPGAGISLAERIGLEHVFFPIVDGGNIMHIFLGESTPDPKGLRDFAMRIAKNTQTGYFAFTRDMTICTDCSHLAPGLKDECPNCGSTNVEQLSRVTGYLQAVSGWNAAKKQELEDRKRYGETDMV